jgi:ammonium transporter Rh
LSSWGFSYLSDVLEAKIGLRDTCGVHNLHGMPGLLGGLVPIIALTSCCEHSAAHAQILAVLCTLFIAIASGALAACLVKLIPTETGNALTKITFEDAKIFEEVEEED